MARELPEDVVAFLLDNPSELELLVGKMRAIESNKKWHAEIAEKRKNAPMVPCDTYGCTNPRNEMDPMCSSCYADYRTDPDAYK